MNIERFSSVMMRWYALFACGIWADVLLRALVAGDGRAAVWATAAIGVVVSTWRAVSALCAWLDGVRDRWLERLWEEHRR